MKGDYDMYIVLEQKEYQKIAQAIADANEDRGTICVEIDGFEFDVKFEKSVKMYNEDDYRNGTGAWVVSSADVSVKHIKHGDVIVDYNRYDIEGIAENIIKQ